MSNAADTYNWDTAFAIKFADANAAIATQKSSPPSFASTYTDGFSGITYDVTGDFNAWALSGGSGNLVQMMLPVINGVFAPSGGGESLDFSGTANIQVNLMYIPQPGASSGQNQQLVVDTQVVSVLSFVFDADSPWKGQASAVQSAMQTWLNSNLQEFNHTFAVVNINAVADQGSYQWLKPTLTGYAVNQEGATDPNDYVFGVMAMTLNDQGSNLSYEISPNAIPAGSNAGFLISQNLFLQQMFMPGMALMFNNATASSFAISEDGTQITNNMPLTFQSLQLDSDTTVSDATVGTGNFTLTAFDNQLEFQFVDLNFYWKAGFTVHIDYTGFAMVSVDSTGHLQMPQTGTPSVQTNITQSEGAQWLEIGASVAIGLGVSIAGALIGGALGAAADAAEDEAGNAAKTAVDDAAGSDAGNANFGVNGIEPNAAENPQQVVQDDQTGAAGDINNAADPSYAQKFKGFFGRNWQKILGGVIGSLFGSTPTIVAQILKDYAQDESANPWTLTQFATEALQPVQWPAQTGYTLNGAALNRSLQLGINVSYQ